MAVSDEAAADTEVAPTRAIELIEAGAVLIDVRRPYEYEGGRLAGSRNIEMNDVSAAAESIPRDRSVLFYCRSGKRSGMAAQAFREAGYDASTSPGDSRPGRPRATARARRRRGAQAAASVVGSARGGRRTKADPAVGRTDTAGRSVHPARGSAHPARGPAGARRPAQAAAGGPGADRRPAGAGRQAPTGVHPAVADAREQRIEDTRAWIARTDRKLGVRTYALGAGVVLALAAGIVGVVLALSAKDESATKDEVRALRDQVEAVQQEAAEAAEEDVATLTEQLDALEGRVNTIASSQRTSESELSVVQDDIDDLRNQISGLERSGGGGSGNP